MSSCNVESSSVSYHQVHEWPNLLLAWQKAAKGKRSGKSCAAFEYRLADHLLELKHELINGTYHPGKYTHFYIHEPKHRKISAAPFRDRVVHHALCNIIEPVFEQRFIPDSYANRKGKGTHKAISRLQQFSRTKRYVLRLDIVKHFPSLDHEILYRFLCQYLPDKKLHWLIRTIINSGKDIFDQSADDYLFPGDDLLSLCRPRGLPIGNLTSQFWSNCYLHPLDMFIKRELRCDAYLRYVDDFALLSDSKSQLWQWKQAIQKKLNTLRLRFHAHSAQVSPVSQGIPWLGMVIYPDHIRVKQRKIIHTNRKLKSRFEDWQQGKISFAEFDASVQGWINHVRYADSWGLRKHILRQFNR